MAKNLELSATLELLDKITAPLRTIQGQVERATDAFDDARNAVRKLERQQGQITSFNNMSQSLGTLENQLQDARKRMHDLQRQMQATAQPTQRLINQFNAAQRSAQQLEQRFARESHSLNQLRQSMQSAGINTDRLADEQSRLAREVDKATHSLDNQRNKMSNLQRLQKQSQKMGDMRNKALGVATAGATATFAGAMFIQPGLELEQAMSKVQALTRLDTNSEQYKALEAQAKQLGSTTAFTSADSARGQAFLAMAGFTPEAIQKALPSVLDLALAGDMELPQVADIASNILSGMNLDSSEMTKVGDVLSAAFTRANLDIAMLGETMKYAAPGATGLNVSLEELASMAGKLGDAGIQGSAGGTALRAIMSRLASPAKAGQKALDKLRISTIDTNGNLRPMIDILSELQQKTKKLGNAERLGLLKDIAGEEASNALQILIDKAGSGELQKLTADLKGSDGELQNLAKTMNNNTLGDFKSLTSALDGLRTAIFDTNKDAIRNFIQSVTELTQKITTFANAHPELIALLGKLFAMLAIGAVIFGTIGAVMLTILGPMALLRASLVTLGLPSTLTPLGMLAKAFSLIGTVIRAVGVAMMANPLLALLALLAILAYTIYKNWDTLGPMFARLWAWISNGASELWQNLVNIWGNIKQSVIDYANQLWSGLGITFDNGIMALIGILLAFNPVTLFIQAFLAVWTYLSGLGAKFREYGANMLQGLADGIMSKAKAVINTITGIASRIKGAFTSARGMDIHSPSRVFTKYGDYIMQGLNNGLLTNDSPIATMLATSDNLRNAMDTSQIRFDNRKPIMATGMAQLSGAGQAPATININIYTQPNQSEQEIARLVAIEVAKANNNRHKNTALYDLAEAW